METVRKINASKVSVWVILGLIWAGMFVLNLITPYVADDFAYMISFKTQWWIEKVWDVFPSMAAHAKTMNGRLISHGFGQLFMLWPKVVFDLVNALVFTGLMAIMYRLVKPANSENALLLAAVFGAVWLFMPVFGQVALWQIGSVNYLWALLFGLLYLRPFIRDYVSEMREKTVLWKKILFCVFAFLFGTYTEVTSFICVFLAAVFLLLGRIVKKRSLKTWLVAPVVIAAVGYLVLMNMPAEMNAKGAGMDLAVLLENFTKAAIMLKEYGFVLLGVWAVALVLGLYAKLDADRLTVSAVLAFGAVAANYMLSVASYYPERCFCTTATLLVLAVMVLVPGLAERGKAELCSCAVAVLAIATVFSLVTGAADIWKTHVDYSLREQRIAEAKENGETDITVPVIRPSTKYSAYWGLTDLVAGDWQAWPNNYISTYYGVHLTGM